MLLPSRNGTFTPYHSVIRGGTVPDTVFVGLSPQKLWGYLRSPRDKPDAEGILWIPAGLCRGCPARRSESKP